MSNYPKAFVFREYQQDAKCLLFNSPVKYTKTITDYTKRNVRRLFVFRLLYLILSNFKKMTNLKRRQIGIT